MAIPIKAELVKVLIETRYGSIDDFLVHWEHRVEARRQKTGSARNRATLYRWLRQGIPSREDDIYGFSAALGVDPVAILNLSREFVERTFSKERLWFQLNAVSRSPLAPLWLLYRPSPSWPNTEITHRYYGHAWHTLDFDHDPQVRANVYAAVKMTTDATAPLPRVYHFAYRGTNARDSMWRPYGSVIRFSAKTVLVSESGDYQEDTLARSADFCVAETHFGEGPAEFRVASLHPFTGSVSAPSLEDGAVRFWG